jgi:hypothetical protein
MTSHTEWHRVRRDRPGPICGRPDWCHVVADDRKAVCARIESSMRCGEAGWLHRLRADPHCPTGVRSMRDRLCSDATHRDVRDAIDATAARPLVVRTVATGRGK